jgi:hypothetical protein
LPARGEVLDLVRATGFAFEELELEALSGLAELEGGALPSALSHVPPGALRALLPVFPTVVLFLRK